MIQYQAVRLVYPQAPPALRLASPMYPIPFSATELAERRSSELGGFDPTKLPSSAAIAGIGAITALYIADKLFGPPLNTIAKVMGWGAVSYSVYRLFTGVEPSQSQRAQIPMPPPTAPVTFIPAKADFDKIRIAFIEPRPYQRIPASLLGKTNYPINLIITNDADRPVTFNLELVATEKPISRTDQATQGLVKQTTITAPPRQSVQLRLEGKVFSSGLFTKAFEVRLEALKRRGTDEPVKATEVIFYTE